MKIFVTGADGFIGSHLVEALVKNGHDVVCLICPEDDRSNISHLHVKKVKGDVRDAALLDRTMHGCDWVFHLAATMNNPFYDSTRFFSVNVQGTRNVMEAALNNRVKKVLHVSSIVTIKEDNRIVDERGIHSGRFDCPYTQTKFLGEKIALEYGAQGLPLVIAHPTIVFGPRAHDIGRFFNMHLQSKIRFASYQDTRLNVIYVKDLAKGLLLAMKKGKPGQKYILGGQEVYLKEFLEKLDRVAGVKRPIIYLPDWAVDFAISFLTPFTALLKIPLPASKAQVNAMKRGTSVDSSKAKRELGFRVRPLEEALHETIKWYRLTGDIRF